MRKQIAAANWKMNLTYQEAEKLLNELLDVPSTLSQGQLAVFVVPAPYLKLAQDVVSRNSGIHVAAQNVYSKKSGAYTGESSVTMLQSLGIEFAIIGHSERREYFNASNQLFAEKISISLEHNITPIFCGGEPLNIREQNTQNNYVSQQLEESLFQL